MSFIEKLQQRWQIKSTTQVILILIVFACTGMSVLYVKTPIFWLLGITKETHWLLHTAVYIITILPAYQVLLLMYGFLFGQFRFFWEFEKKMLKRMRLIR